MKSIIVNGIFAGLLSVSAVQANGSERAEPTLDSVYLDLSDVDALGYFTPSTNIEAAILAKMWDFSAPCDTNNSLVIELGPESQCVVKELGKFDSDNSQNWSASEITVFVKEVLKMPLFPGTIAKGIIKRFDLNTNEILDANEAEDMVEGLEKKQSESVFWDR